MFRSNKLCAFISFVLVAALFLASCADKKDAVNPAVSESPVPTDSLVIALLPVRNIFEQKKRYQPLADYLSRSLNLRVETKILHSYDEVYNEMLLNKVDAAFFGGLSYIVMSSKVDIEPIARRQNKDGISTYRGVIFALKNGGITEDVSTWKNKRIALVDRSADAGYIFPKYYLYKKGILHFDDYFKKVFYIGSNDASVLSVLSGDAEIGCTRDYILDGEDPLIRESMVVLAASPPLPTDILGLRGSIDKLLKERLRKTLMNMDKTPEGRDALLTMDAVSFIETKRSDFAPIFEMLTTLGIKPETLALEAIGRKTQPVSHGTEAGR